MTLPDRNADHEPPNRADRRSRWNAVTDLVKLGEKTWPGKEWIPWIKYILTIIIVTTVVVGIPASIVWVLVMLLL